MEAAGGGVGVGQDVEKGEATCSLMHETEFNDS